MSIRLIKVATVVREPVSRLPVNASFCDTSGRCPDCGGFEGEPHRNSELAPRCPLEQCFTCREFLGVCSCPEVP